MLYAGIFNVGKVGIQRVGIEQYIGLRLPRMQPRFLYVVRFNPEHTAALGSNGPVIAVIADGADDFRFRNIFDRFLQIGGKPILGRDRTWRAGGLVLIVVHDHKAVRVSRKRSVVVIFIGDWNVEIQLQPMRVQVLSQIFDQSPETWLGV